MTLTPMTVERAYLRSTPSVMYLTPLGIRRDATPGRRYLVYGREYLPPDIVMASPGIGAKELESASEDLAFLDALTSGASGGTIAGVVSQREITYEGVTDVRAPLGGISVTIFNEKYSTEVVTNADGRFVATGIPAGRFQLAPHLPEGLVVWDPTSGIEATVRDGGCAAPKIDVKTYTAVRGVLRGPDGRPLPSTSVDLVAMDLQPDASGHIRGTGSVSTNERGEFKFMGRPPGRYYLGVSLDNAPNPYGPSYPRTYYPGTTDRASATPIIVESGRSHDGFDFSIPMILPKGELEVRVESNRGPVTLCFVELEDQVQRRSSWTIEAGVPWRSPVVDGQRYEVHVHVGSGGYHLESEPYRFTATTQKTVVILRPDAPRTLH